MRDEEFGDVMCLGARSIGLLGAYGMVTWFSSDRTEWNVQCLNPIFLVLSGVCVYSISFWDTYVFCHELSFNRGRFNYFFYVKLRCAVPRFNWAADYVDGSQYMYTSRVYSTRPWELRKWLFLFYFIKGLLNKYSNGKEILLSKIYFISNLLLDKCSRFSTIYLQTTTTTTR